MYTVSEGIVLKQIKTLNSRRMLVVLTEKFGKISAGTSIPEKGKNKTSLALRPFTLGRYELYKNKDLYNINSAETVKSYYKIGEDVDKYMAASYVLELSDKMLLEGDEATGMYKILCDFLALLENRNSDYQTLVIGFQVKALSVLGLSLSQNPLMKEQSNDKITIVDFIEKHALGALEKLTIPEDSSKPLEIFLKQYIADNLGIENLKSEGFQI